MKKMEWMVNCGSRRWEVSRWFWLCCKQKRNLLVNCSWQYCNILCWSCTAHLLQTHRACSARWSFRLQRKPTNLCSLARLSSSVANSRTVIVGSRIPGIYAVWITLFWWPNHLEEFTRNLSRDAVLEDWPQTRAHLGDKVWWPWPRSGLALTFLSSKRSGLDLGLEEALPHPWS